MSDNPTERFHEQVAERAELKRARLHGRLRAALLLMAEYERAKVWCALNRFRWPEQFLADKPAEWESSDDRLRMKLPVAAELWRALQDTTSHKACLREWNRDTMDDAKFEEWWARRHPTRTPQ